MLGVFQILTNPEPSQPSIGIFDNHSDIGDVGMPGNATYDSETGEYVITGSGIGSPETYYQAAAHIVYKEITGSFTIKANMRVEGSGSAASSIGIYDSLDKDCIACVFAVFSWNSAGVTIEEHSWIHESMVWGRRITIFLVTVH